MTAPSLTHMERARQLLEAWYKAAPADQTAVIARALAAEHDAALERAAVEAETWRQACLPPWSHQQAENTAERIRAMKEGK